ncbi:MAG: tripartite tricarboxylate transporter permease, partial [Candidatus Thermoplasmatota archaeon]
MEFFLLALFALLFSLIGVFIGAITGIIPGLHVNNISFIILASYPTIAGGLILFGSDITILVCVLLMSILIMHTFINFVPAVFLGAPEGEMALSVLPGHR